MSLPRPLHNLPCLGYCGNQGCNKVFEFRQSVRNHIAWVLTRVKCSYCLETSAGPDALEYHINQNHQDQSPFTFGAPARAQQKLDIKNAYAAWRLAIKQRGAQQATASGTSGATAAGTFETSSMGQQSIVSGPSEVTDSVWSDMICYEGWHHTEHPSIIAYTNGHRWTYMQNTISCEYILIPEDSG